MEMKTDIVFPSGNEKEFLEIGERLGFKSLIFVYRDLSKVKEIKNGIKISYGVLVSETDKKKLIKKIDKIKQKNYLALVQARDESFNRFVLEKTRADTIHGLEWAERKDAMHYRRSGLDQVLCKIAKEKGKIIVFSLKDVLKPIILGRMAQNIKLCKKYKIKFLLGSFAKQIGEMKNEHDLSYFLSQLQQKFL